MKSKIVNTVAIVVLTAALSGYAQESQEQVEMEEDSRADQWQVQVGWVHQFGRGMSVSGPAPSMLLGTHSQRTGVGLTYPNNGAFIPRKFDDGFVSPDVWTGDAGLLSDPNPERYGMTFNWGVKNASQYNYDGGINPTLTYHINRGESVGKVSDVKEGNSDDDYQVNGIEVKARHLLRSWVEDRGSNNMANARTVLDLNLVVGLAWFPSSTQRNRRSVGQDLYRMTETYTFSDYYGSAAGGSWGALDVPYSGTYGSATDAGPLILATPLSASLRSAYQGTFVDSIALESDFWHLRGVLGVELAMPLTDRLSIYASPQAVLEFIDIDVERTETVTFTDRSGARTTIASQTDKRHKTTVAPGVLLTAGADYRINDNWFAGASFGWEKLFSDPSVHVGSDKVKYDLDGGEFSLYIGRNF